MPPCPSPTAAPSHPPQTQTLAFEFDLQHPPEKVWRALTEPALLSEWLLPVVELHLEPGAAFMFRTQPYPGWDGTVSCRFSRSRSTGSSATRGPCRSSTPS